jgi:ArsR family transcriptional regulator, arsenate/arsenite/antimonite-responsive transcriptional repressor
MKTDDDLAQVFAALGHPSRMAIFRALLVHGAQGLSFGALAEGTGIAPSTLTHHLRELEAAAILRREVTGRSTWLRLDLGVLTQALAELTQMCCTAPPLDHSQPETHR